jgi:hypothetical protein
MTAVGLGRRGRRDGGGRVEQRASVRTRIRLDRRSADREPARCTARRRCRRRCRGLDARDAIPDGGHGRDGRERGQRKRRRTGIRGCGCCLHRPQLKGLKKGKKARGETLCLHCQRIENQVSDIMDMYCTTSNIRVIHQ